MTAPINVKTKIVVNTEQECIVENAKITASPVKVCTYKCALQKIEWWKIRQHNEKCLVGASWSEMSKKVPAKSTS